MSNRLSLIKLSKKLLSKPYWALEELRDELSITETQLNKYLEQLSEKYDEIGIILDVIVLPTPGSPIRIIAFCFSKILIHL